MLQAPDPGVPGTPDVLAVLTGLARTSTAAPLGTVGAEIAELVLNGLPSVAVCLAVVHLRRVLHWEIAGVKSLAFVLDERQYPRGFGPCLDAAFTGRAVIVGDGGGRYEDYRRLVKRHGVRQVVSLPLLPTLAGPGVGALTLYGADAQPRLVAPSDDLVNRFAAVASVLVADALRYNAAVLTAQQLEQAMQSRSVIEQAKGMIMFARGCSADEAFEWLTRVSSTRSLKVRDVAVMIVQQAGTAQSLEGWSPRG
jgi:hypothetical protein